MSITSPMRPNLNAQELTSSKKARTKRELVIPWRLRVISSTKNVTDSVVRNTQPLSTPSLLYFATSKLWTLHTSFTFFSSCSMFNSLVAAFVISLKNTTTEIEYKKLWQSYMQSQEQHLHSATKFLKTQEPYEGLWTSRPDQFQINPRSTFNFLVAVFVISLRIATIEN